MLIIGNHFHSDESMVIAVTKEQKHLLIFGNLCRCAGS